MARWFKIIFVLVAIVFMLLAVSHQWEQIRALNWTFDPWMMIGSVLLLVAVFFLDAYGWHLILIMLGRRLAVKTSIKIWMISSIARYIPGGVWSYTSRMAMAQQAGVSLTESSISLYLETLLLMASSLAVGLPALLMLADFPYDRTFTVLIFVLLGFALHPRFIALLRFMPGKIGRCMARLSLPSVGYMFGLYLYYVLLWLLLCSGFVVFVSSLFPLDIRQSLLVGASLALSFFAGFVVVFAPGGLGVRESVLYFLLVSYMTPAASLLVSLGSRLWVMLGEGISLVVVLLPGSKLNR